MLLESVLCGALAFFFVSFPCELGQRFSDAFSHIDYIIGQINWYLLPINIRKTLPITIQYTQQTFAIRFFGSHSCNRKQHKKASMHTSHTKHLIELSNKFWKTVLLNSFQVVNVVFRSFMAAHKLYKWSNKISIFASWQLIRIISWTGPIFFTQNQNIYFKRMLSQSQKMYKANKIHKSDIRFVVDQYLELSMQ